MSFFEIILLAVAMSIDAMLVCFSYGLFINSKRTKNALMLSTSFGFFQFLMPIIGWYLSSFVYSYLQNVSKWIVFSIFVVLGTKFLIDAFEKNKYKFRVDCIEPMCVLILAVATSIDALGAGISLRFVNANILFVSIIIGGITFVNSLIGFCITQLFKKIPARYIVIVGAILLYYLAVKAII